MRSIKVIIGVLGGVTAGIILGTSLASRRTLTLRKKVIARGDEYLRMIMNKLDHKKEPTNESAPQQKERTIKQAKFVKDQT